MTDSPVEYDYDEVIHNAEGKLVHCQNCGERVFLTHVASMGCHMCDAEPRDITIHAKQEET